ncbi:MAG: Cof-type HAD-IIB family hydrolase [Salinispira sp.]
MYRLLATDVDDTLLALDGTLPAATRKTLQELYDRGIMIVFSSGRATSSLRAVASRIIPPPNNGSDNGSDNEYLISYNGGRVSTAGSNTIIFEQALSQELIAEILTHTRRADLHVQAYRSEGFIVERHDSTRQKWIDYYVGSATMNWAYVDDMPSAVPNGSIKLLIIGEHEKLCTLQKALAPIAQGKFDMFFSKPMYLEVVASGVNKGTALAMLARHINIPVEDCIAFGDSNNDIEMLTTAGLGVAVANASDELKAIADHVLTRSADEAALVELAEQYFPND